MAVGTFPENLVRLVVVVEWTPDVPEYAVTLHDDVTGRVLDTFRYMFTELPGNNPDSTVLDVAVYQACGFRHAKPAELARHICGLGFTEWHNPAALPNSARAKFAGAEA
jgi:hypothetical protein